MMKWDQRLSTVSVSKKKEDFLFSRFKKERREREQQKITPIIFVVVAWTKKALVKKEKTLIFVFFCVSKVTYLFESIFFVA